MLTVTVDSNIYISALVFAGLPLQFLDAARARVFRFAISDPLLIEVDRVLRIKFQWSDEASAEALRLLAEIAERVEPTEVSPGPRKCAYLLAASAGSRRPPPRRGR